MSVIKIEIEDEKYEVEANSFTMGEKWLLARDFGVDWGDPDSFGYGGLLGVIVVALVRAGLPESAAKERVLALKDEQVTITEESDEPDPTPAAKGGKKTTRATAGKSGS